MDETSAVGPDGIRVRHVKALLRFDAAAATHDEGVRVLHDLLHVWADKSIVAEEAALFDCKALGDLQKAGGGN